MRTLFGAACAIAALAGTPAFAQTYGGYSQDQNGSYQTQAPGGYYQNQGQGGYYQNQGQGGYYQDQEGYPGQNGYPAQNGYDQNQAQYDQQRQQYEEQRQQYEQNRDAYQQRREDYDASREAYRQNYHEYQRQYHRWVRGAYLPYEYRNRWATISNYSYYHLRHPPRGYSWVFDGESYLLINRGTGYIAEVMNPGDAYFVPYRTY